MGTLTSRSYPDHRPKLIGWPFPDSAEVKVIDAEGHQQPPDAVGELCFRHPHVMPGYYKDTENTAQNLRDGWVHTGDLCAVDDQGRVYFHGRLKNIIKRAGENIAGEEVEFTIMAHPKVEECIVFGVDDPVMTEEVFATIVVREGETLTADQVVSWCSQELSSWKAPRFIQLRTEAFPRLANGKTDRKAVIEAVDVNGAWDRRGAGARV
jgi:crotonobetaine/carnitine-CoA ligase